MEYLTLILAEIGVISIVAFVLTRIHRLAKSRDEFFGGCLYVASLLIGMFAICMLFVPMKECTIDLIPSKAKVAIRNLEKENDSLRAEVAIYKGMNREVHGLSLDDDVYFSNDVNPKFYHLRSNCLVLAGKSTKIKVEKMEKAIGEGRIDCGFCGGKGIISDEAAEPDENSSSDMVYVCTSGTSKRYHSDRYCSALSRCSGEIEEVSVEEAEDMGRTPCHICY